MFAPDMRSLCASTAAAALAVLLGCGQASDRPEATANDAPRATPAGAPPTESVADADFARTKAEEIFSMRCITCHGEEGAGDGPGSAGLQPPPRDLRDPGWQASVSDEHIEKLVLYGGAAVGRSPMMPGNPDLMSQQEVVTALVAKIRGLASP